MSDAFGAWRPRSNWRKHLSDAGTRTRVHEEPHGRDSWVYYAGEEAYFEGGSASDSDVSLSGVSSPTELTSRVAARHANGEKVMFLDLFGQGMYGFKPEEEPGEDLDIAATYLNPKDTFHAARKGATHFKRANIEHVSGDLFTREGWSNLIRVLDERRAAGYVLDTIFMRPVGGLDNYAELPEAWRHLFNVMLRDVYERLATGGQMLLELSSFPEHHLESVLTAFQDCFSVEVNGERIPRIPGIVLTRKREDSYDRPVFKLEKLDGAPVQLPTLQEFRRKYGVTM